MEKLNAGFLGWVEAQLVSGKGATAIFTGACEDYLRYAQEIGDQATEGTKANACKKGESPAPSAPVVAQSSPLGVAAMPAPFGATSISAVPAPAPAAQKEKAAIVFAAPPTSTAPAPATSGIPGFSFGALPAFPPSSIPAFSFPAASASAPFSFAPTGAPPSLSFPAGAVANTLYPPKYAPIGGIFNGGAIPTITPGEPFLHPHPTIPLSCLLPAP